MKHLVVTTINAPNAALRALASGAQTHGWNFTVIGDRKSPPSFDLPGADYYDLARQDESGLEFAKRVPTGHYARKNIGYLLAIQQGASSIVETDDDNLPLDDFWAERQESHSAVTLSEEGWCNVYRYFTDAPIWPRGLPLDEIQQAITPRAHLSLQTSTCPVQQGLANDNPDVDAIYRLAFPLPMSFEKADAVALRGGAWCPFNSQNTTWMPAAFPLMYLPFHCSFRMTDIWRSFVVQRILYGNGHSILFHEATVYQDRNDHILMKDFADEVVGYLNNRAIRERLLDLPLSDTPSGMLADVESCYELLIEMELVGTDERELIKAWRTDVSNILEKS